MKGTHPIQGTVHVPWFWHIILSLSFGGFKLQKNQGHDCFGWRSKDFPILRSIQKCIFMSCWGDCHLALRFRLRRFVMKSWCFNTLFLVQVLNFSFVNLCEEEIFLKDWDVIIPARGFKEAGTVAWNKGPITPPIKKEQKRARMVGWVICWGWKTTQFVGIIS